MQQRYYDPETGRVLSVDPVQANPNTGANFNRYAYANDNPYRYTDPDGRLSHWLRSGGGHFGSGCGWPLPSPTCQSQLATGGQSNAKPNIQTSSPLSIGQKISRNFSWLRDSVKLEGEVGLGLGASARIGQVRVSFELGRASPFGAGATLSDVYTFTEVKRPSFAFEVGHYAAGWVGAVDRMYAGRHDLRYSEEHIPGGLVFGRKPWEGDTGSGEVGVHVSAGLLQMDASIDVGKAAVAIFYWGDSRENP